MTCPTGSHGNGTGSDNPSFIRSLTDIIRFVACDWLDHGARLAEINLNSGGNHIVRVYGDPIIMPSCNDLYTAKVMLYRMGTIHSEECDMDPVGHIWDITPYNCDKGERDRLLNRLSFNIDENAPATEVASDDSQD